MLNVGPFTVVCDRPEDAEKILKLFGKISTAKTRNSVRFGDGATIRRKTATKPTSITSHEIDIRDFMETRRPAAQPTPRH